MTLKRNYLAKATLRKKKKEKADKLQSKKKEENTIHINWKKNKRQDIWQ